MTTSAPRFSGKLRIETDCATFSVSRRHYIIVRVTGISLLRESASLHVDGWAGLVPLCDTLLGRDPGGSMVPLGLQPLSSGGSRRSNNHKSSRRVNSLGTLSRTRLVRVLSRHSSGRLAVYQRTGNLVGIGARGM